MAKFKYKSLEDGQIVTSDEPREDLEELARWVRVDGSDQTGEPTGIVPSNTEPVAGPVNTSPVTGGEPPLVSTSAGIADPAATLSSEQAVEKAAADAQAAEEAAAEENAGDSGNDGTGEQTGDGSEAPVRPNLNGSTEEWLAYARHDSVKLEVADDEGRDAIIAEYIEKFAPSGNASREQWVAYAEEHGVTVGELKRDEIREAVIAAGWATA